MISKWRQSWKNWSFERIENTLALSFKSQGVYTGFTNWEDDTTHLIISMLFLFFNWLDSYHNNVRSKEVIKTLPSQLQRVNMSHSSFFQQNLLAVFVFDVGPRNAMFYDVVWGQCDRLLCSVQKVKTTYQNTKYAFYFPYQRWVFYLFFEHQCFWTLYSVDQQLLVSIIIFPSPSTSFTDKCREGNIFSYKGYYKR